MVHVLLMPVLKDSIKDMVPVFRTQKDAHHLMTSHYALNVQILMNLPMEFAPELSSVAQTEPFTTLLPTFVLQ
jgi:hypothetical protein